MAGPPANVNILVIADVDEEVEQQRHDNDGRDGEKLDTLHVAAPDGHERAGGAEDQHGSEAERDRDPHVSDRHRVHEHLDEATPDESR